MQREQHGMQQHGDAQRNRQIALAFRSPPCRCHQPVHVKVNPAFYFPIVCAGICRDSLQRLEVAATQFQRDSPSFRPTTGCVVPPQFGNRGNALQQRQVIEFNQGFPPDGGIDRAHAFLRQPAQAPIALDVALEFGIGAIGQIKIAQGGEQQFRFRFERRRIAKFRQAINCHWLIRST